LYPCRDQRLREFFGCLSRAIQYLHDKRVRHRDIKPANILIHEDRVKIADFGLSLNWAERSSTTASTGPGGTPRYYAPEVAQYKRRSSSSDIWSLGCIFLEMVTVLSGRTVDDLLEFISVYDSDHFAAENVCYNSNPNAIKAWIKELKVNNNRNTDPIYWVDKMLDPERENRPTAAVLVEYTGHEGKDLGWEFCGNCCRTDSDYESDESEDLGFNSIARVGSSDIGITTQTNEDHV